MVRLGIVKGVRVIETHSDGALHMHLVICSYHWLIDGDRQLWGNYFERGRSISYIQNPSNWLVDFRRQMNSACAAVGLGRSHWTPVKDSNAIGCYVSKYISAGCALPLGAKRYEEFGFHESPRCADFRMAYGESFHYRLMMRALFGDLHDDKSEAVLKSMSHFFGMNWLSVIDALPIGEVMASANRLRLSLNAIPIVLDASGLPCLLSICGTLGELCFYNELPRIHAFCEAHEWNCPEIAPIYPPGGVDIFSWRKCST
jgi:hypothetical protein